ncbi:MAG: hypothetical protein HY423_01550 [Candidatus Lambdaproteobacteria bacterium]|nr:hypothetical protein [Candidatus Lambdaproteobacteria bacterium]
MARTAAKTVRREREYAIPGKCSPGMFPSEYAVTIQLGDKEFSLFADRRDVKLLDAETGECLVRVRVFDKKKQIISLPGETLENGRQFAVYPIDQLHDL